VSRRADSVRKRSPKSKAGSDLIGASMVPPAPPGDWLPNQEALGNPVRYRASALGYHSLPSMTSGSKPQFNIRAVAESFVGRFVYLNQGAEKSIDCSIVCVERTFRGFYTLEPSGQPFPRLVRYSPVSDFRNSLDTIFVLTSVVSPA
jgi:hypothetical protein